MASCASKAFCSLQKSNMREIVGTGAVILYLVSHLFLEYSTFVSFFTTLRTWHINTICDVIVVCIALYIIISNRSYREFSFFAITALPLTFLYLSTSLTGDTRLLIVYVLLIAIADIDLTRLCTAYYIAGFTCIILIMSSCVAGLIVNIDVIPNGRLVFSYGFGHPNVLGMLLFSTIGAMTFSHWRRSTWTVPLFLSVFASLFSYYTLSANAATAVLGLLSLVNLLGHVTPNSLLVKAPTKANIRTAALIVIPSLLCLLMWIGTALFAGGSPLLSLLDNLIHKRMFFAHAYYAKFGGFTLYGRQYTIVPYHHAGTVFNSVDSGYCYLALVTGIVPSLTLLLPYFVTIKRIIASHYSFVISAVIIIQALLLLTAQSPLFLAANWAILLLSRAFSSETTDDGSKITRHADNTSGTVSQIDLSAQQ